VTEGTPTSPLFIVLTTSLTVPSPPTATTSGQPPATARCASAVAARGAAVSPNSNASPSRGSRSRSRGQSRAVRPDPAAGFTTTKARAVTLVRAEAWEVLPADVPGEERADLALTTDAFSTRTRRGIA